MNLPIGTVTLKDLVSELDNWFHLGIQLEVSATTLQNIRHRHHHTGDIEAMKTDMFIAWRDNEEHGPKWSTIVRALVGIKMVPLARKLGMKYGRDWCTLVWAANLVTHEQESVAIYAIYTTASFI